MKHNINKQGYTKKLVQLLAMVLLFTACEKGLDLRDAEYPEQLIYLPAAVGGWFQIDDVAHRIGDAPIPGNPARYVADLENNQFIIPLGVYRSGIDNSGAFSVTINANSDTINGIIAAGDTTISLLPSDQYTMDNSVSMADGEELAKFQLAIDLEFLKSGYPTEVYALGVSISSTDRETSPRLGTAIVVVHSIMLKPVAYFRFRPENTDKTRHTIAFFDRSDYASTLIWDFGDGSEYSNENDPIHFYENSGTYTVTLTALGVTGEADKSLFIEEVTIP